MTIMNTMPYYYCDAIDIIELVFVIMLDQNQY